MRILSTALIVLSLLLMANSAHAKTKQPEKHMDQQAMMDLYKKLATPGEPHKLFASLAGSWTTKTKEWMEAGKPPMQSEGTVEMKMLLDGRYLQQEYQGTMMGQPFTGISINAYDNLTKHYATTWMSTTGTNIFIMEGTASADGKTITLNGQHAVPGGGQMTHRAVWKIIDNNNQTFDMYGAHHGGKEMKMMEIVYQRKP
jgi:hypothetical protein